MDLQPSLQALPAGVGRLVVAFSGGIDSVALLHLLQASRDRYRLSLWHVHHGLQPNADEMAAFARRSAQRLGIDCRVDHLELDPAQANLEAVAREARYRLFASGLDDRSALLTAHHRDDQAETLLLNLLRGSGPAGLAGIAPLRPLGNGWLLRPLLGVSRRQIEDWVKSRGLQWIEDPSNKALHADRNFLRHRVLPLLGERWPQAAASLAQAAAWQGELAGLQQDLARIDAARCLIEHPYSEHPCLATDALRQLSPARQKNLVRYWIRKATGIVIDRHRLEQLIAQGGARADAQPLIALGNFSLRRYRSAWYLVPAVLPQRLPPRAPCGCGQRLRYLPELDAAERRRHGHRLKHLFQQAGVPPWLRERVPLCFGSGRPVALG
jgi:tRNA(Ile)-lysidine synthase